MNLCVQVWWYCIQGINRRRVGQCFVCFSLLPQKQFGTVSKFPLFPSFLFLSLSPSDRRLLLPYLFTSIVVFSPFSSGLLNLPAIHRAGRRTASTAIHSLFLSFSSLQTSQPAQLRLASFLGRSLIVLALLNFFDGNITIYDFH